MTDNRDWYTYPRTGAPQRREGYVMREDKDYRMGVGLCMLSAIGVLAAIGAAVWDWVVGVVL